MLRVSGNVKRVGCTAADRESIKFWKHQVQDDEVIGHGARHEESFLAVLCEIHRIPFFSEPLWDEPRNIRVVFNNTKCPS